MNIKFLAIFVAATLFCLAASSSTFAQGKSRGGGQGQGQGQGRGQGQGQGQGQGSGNASGKSDSDGSDVPVKSSDDSRGKSNGKGKSDEQRALHAKQKAAKLSDKDLNRYKGLAKKLGATPEEMRARYEWALMRDPNLTYGNFVSAHMAADNLGDRYPNVSSDAILIGMSRGRSLGQTLQDLKVAPDQSQTLQKTINEKLRSILGN